MSSLSPAGPSSSLQPSAAPPSSSAPASSSAPVSSSVALSSSAGSTPSVGPSPSTSAPQSSSQDPSQPPVSSTPASSSSPIADASPASTTAPQPSSTFPTLRSTVFVTTTDSLGHTTTSAPITITSVTTFTSNGVPVTSTEIKLNPTLGSDGPGSGGSSFFKNTGAVAGVFVLVGLAAAAILLWILFGLRRRRRNRRIEHDTAVSATLAAAGFHRAPLDDDEHDGSGSRRSRALASSDIEMRTGSALGLGTKSSLPSARTSGYLDSPGHDDGFNPYQEYVATGLREGYGPVRTQSPPPAAFAEPYRDAGGSGPDHVTGHSASQSVGSIEPLLASFNRASPVSPAPARPAKNPRRETDTRPPLPVPPENRRQSTSSVYSSESTGDDRLNPALRNSEIEDSEDYSRVLGVRNIPDGVSYSGES
ncbi:hypothetical protein B0H15DRAFT_812712 [Mycena belliarum]|uniref:Uncharacterized protein n=1 Tax=Mycena belliarum TaxID=1033014 RepID=A0AAD6UKX0_9AGAR|nr:hypothetical protein B0H15DRAFT_812712 [Mycena belliae]